jgi:hypothetical protein
MPVIYGIHGVPMDDCFMSSKLKALKIAQELSATHPDIYVSEYHYPKLVTKDLVCLMLSGNGWAHFIDTIYEGPGWSWKRPITPSDRRGPGRPKKVPRTDP